MAERAPLNRRFQKNRNRSGSGASRDASLPGPQEQLSQSAVGGGGGSGEADESHPLMADSDNHNQPPEKPPKNLPTAAEQLEATRQKNRDEDNRDGSADEVGGGGGGGDGEDAEGQGNKSRFRRGRGRPNAAGGGADAGTSSASSNNDSNAPPSNTTTNRANIRERERDVPPSSNQPPAPILPPSAQFTSFPWSLFRSDLCCNLGYRMGYVQRLPIKAKGMASRELMEGWCVGVNVLSCPTSGNDLIGLVRPFVRVHTVQINSGLYMKAARQPPVKPVCTRVYPLRDTYSYPNWQEDLFLDIGIADFLSEDTLVLFELLDEKPSLSMRTDGRRKLGGCKRVAWGYLLPVGHDGTLNVGLCKEWIPQDAKKRGGGADVGGRRSPRAAVSGDPSGGAVSGSPRHDTPRADEVGPQDRRIRIQLFSYVTDNLLSSVQRKILGWPSKPAPVPSSIPSQHSPPDPSFPDGVPEVYSQWRRQRLSPLDGCFISVTMGPRKRRELGTDGFESAGVLIPEAIASAVGSPSRHLSLVTMADESTLSSANKHELQKVRAAVMRRSRAPKEACIVPDRHVHSLVVGPEGALVSAFSHSGHLLAVAARSFTLTAPLSDQNSGQSDPHCVHGLRFIDTDVGTEVWGVNVAHHAVIYDVKWSNDDSYVVTCSGDGSVKVWDVSCYLKGGGGRESRAATLHKEHNNNEGGDPHHHARPSVFTHHSTHPYLLHTLSSFPPLFVYAAIFEILPSSSSSSSSSSSANSSPAKDNILDKSNSAPFQISSSFPPSRPLPRIITGSSDGRIRVWEGPNLHSYVVVGDVVKNYPPHQGRVNSLVIDERSRYLLSADSLGEVCVWRKEEGKLGSMTGLGASGGGGGGASSGDGGRYQLLRKLRKENLDMNAIVPGAALGSPRSGYGVTPGHMGSGGLGVASRSTVDSGMVGGVSGVVSLCMHPDKSRGQLLTLSHNLVLRIYTMATYRVASTLIGNTHGVSATSLDVFQRASYSADGQFVACGVSEGLGGGYKIKIWEVSTGQVVSCPLSDITFPYPIRSIAWHPRQHLIAVGSVGVGASLCIYSAERESADAAVKRSHAIEAEVNIATLATTNTNTNTNTNTTTTDRESDKYKDRLGISSSSSSSLESTIGDVLASASKGVSKESLRLNLNATGAGAGSYMAESKGSPVASDISKAQRAKDILDKIRSERKL